MNDVRPGISLLGIVLILLISQGFFLSFILFISRNRNARSNKYLAFLILFFSFAEVWDILYVTGLIYIVPHLLLVLNPLIFTFGPLVYFYVKSLTDINWKFNLKKLIHFIPAALSYLYFVPVYILSADQKIKLVADAVTNHKFIIPRFFFAIVLIHVLAYLAFSVVKLIKHSGNIRNNFSFTEKVSLKWLRNLLVIFIIIWLLFVVRVFYPMQVLWEVYSFVSLFTFYLIGYLGYSQPEIYKEVKEPPAEQKIIAGNNLVYLPSTYTEEQKQEKKYASSTLSEEEKNICLEKLHNIMSEEKLYLKNDLKLNDVAGKMSIPNYHLSQVINEKHGKNFFDFINSYRVEEVKKLLTDKKYDGMTILAAGYDAGFNSKTAFYSAFKQVTGLTPSEYKKNYNTRQKTAI